MPYFLTALSKNWIYLFFEKSKALKNKSLIKGGLGGEVLKLKA